MWGASILILLLAWSFGVESAFAAEPAASHPPQHWTPADIWRGVDTEKLPLDVQVIKAWEEDGFAYEKLTYVSELAEGVKIHIFAIFGAPKEVTRSPGILHIHGGGHTAEDFSEQ